MDRWSRYFWYVASGTRGTSGGIMKYHSAIYVIES